MTAASPEPPLYQIVATDGRLLRPAPELSKDELLKIHHHLRQVRALDERMMILQRQGRVGFYGACTGQEAPPIGTAAALRPTDWVFPGLREGALMLYRGFSLERYVSQVFGNAHDVLKGRQMPSHYADRDTCYVSWSSCIGTQLPHAVGAAWAAKLRGDDQVCVGFMGDGATSEGDFHAAMTFAGTYRPPCILICQNNHWSISVPTAKQTRARTIAEKAAAYGVPFARVDGNDVLAIYAAVKSARARAAAGEGASFLELVTYRIGAHSSSDDPRVYRDESEVEVWKEKDPLRRFEAHLAREGVLDQARAESIRLAIEAEVAQTVAAAEQHGPPARETLFEDVYATPPWHLEAQAREHLDEHLDR